MWETALDFPKEVVTVSRAIAFACGKGCISMWDRWWPGGQNSFWESGKCPISFD